MLPRRIIFQAPRSCSSCLCQYTQITLWTFGFNGLTSLNASRERFWQMTAAAAQRPAQNFPRYCVRL